MSESRDHYETLQVARSAEPAVIRASYKALIQRYHPDRYVPRTDAESMTRRLNEAYAVLNDPDRRAQHDAELGGRPKPPPLDPSGCGTPRHAEVGAKPAGWSWLWWVALAVVVLIGAQAGRALLGDHIGWLGALLGAAFGASLVRAFSFLWKKAGSTGLRVMLVFAVGLLAVVAAAIVGLMLLMRSGPPLRTDGSGTTQGLDFEPAFTPVPSSAGSPRAGTEPPVPGDRFVQADSLIAARLNTTLPLPLGQAADPTFVWETRQKMFLRLPENVHIYQSDAAFSAWEKGMQAAVDEAAARGTQLDDYQTMEAGRLRMQ